MEMKYGDRGQQGFSLASGWKEMMDLGTLWELVAVDGVTRPGGDGVLVVEDTRWETSTSGQSGIIVSPAKCVRQGCRPRACIGKTCTMRSEKGEFVERLMRLEGVAATLEEGLQYSGQDGRVGDARGKSGEVGVVHLIGV